MKSSTNFAQKMLFFGTEFNAEHEGVAQLQRREHSR
jgi:hypothetical protein